MKQKCRTGKLSLFCMPNCFSWRKTYNWLTKNKRQLSAQAIRSANAQIGVALIGGAEARFTTIINQKKLDQEESAVGAARRRSTRCRSLCCGRIALQGSKPVWSASTRTQTPSPRETPQPVSFVTRPTEKQNHLMLQT